MNDLALKLVDVVNEKGPIKALELVMAVIVEYIEDSKEDLPTTNEVFEALVQMEDDGRIPFINYYLPNTDYREKTIYFPEGTEILFNAGAGNVENVVIEWESNADALHKE